MAEDPISSRRVSKGMFRTHFRPFLLSLVFLSGCGSVEARKLPMPPISPAASYAVEIVDQDGRVVSTYQRGNRIYALGAEGRRYSIRVTNPTGRPIEAVISVDGLDVIDGESADYKKKRGYILAAHSNLEIEGWRVSAGEVAAFRFSSVSNSYAGRKGKARNIGVIGVAIFESKRRPVIPRRGRWLHDYSEPNVSERSSYGRREAKAEDSSPGRSAPASESHKAQKRAGLGTEFGERRRSTVRFTSFERATKNPTAITVIRYNDARGLRRLGFFIPRYPTQSDLALRESANPFPENRFAQPPR